MRLGELVGAVGGLGLLVSSFLPWYSAGGEVATAWQAFSVTDLSSPLRLSWGCRSRSACSAGSQ